MISVLCNMSFTQLSPSVMCPYIVLQIFLSNILSAFLSSVGIVLIPSKSVKTFEVQNAISTSSSWQTENHALSFSPVHNFSNKVCVYSHFSSLHFSYFLLLSLQGSRLFTSISAVYSFILQSVSRQVHSLFQSEISTQYDLVLSPSISSVFSFP
jgi:hypothetical protein